MKSRVLFAITIGAFWGLPTLIPKALADISIIGQEVEGNVVFSYTGQLNGSSLGPHASSVYDTYTFATIIPSFAQIDFGPLNTNFSNSIRTYGDVVKTKPVGIGVGRGSGPDAVSGDYFSIDYDDVSLPIGYVDSTEIAGSMTYVGTTLAALSFFDVGVYTWILDNNEQVTLTIIGNNGEAAKVIKKQIKKLKKKLKAAQRMGQVAKANRFKKKLKRLKKELRALSR